MGGLGGADKDITRTQGGGERPRGSGEKRSNGSSEEWMEEENGARQGV